MTDFESQVVALRSYLLKFARLQLRNDAWAEDAVSDTVLAALAKPQAFDNRSQLKAWIVGILKHKVIDTMRHHSREINTSPLADDDSSDPLDYILFKAHGHFQEPPAQWSNPEQDASSHQFFLLLESCTTHPL